MLKIREISFEYNKLRMLFWGIYDYLLYRFGSKELIQRKRGSCSANIQLLNAFFESYSPENDEQRIIKDYIQKKGINTVFPYRFARDYEFLTAVRFGYDRKSSLYYGKESGKRLYLKQRDFEKAYNYYHELICEQDADSPHLYTDREICGKYLIDIGSAEGIFSLKNIECFDNIIMVEADSDWNDALAKTFKEYGDKTQIINAYAGESYSDSMISVDGLFEEKGIAPSDIVIKIDVEGMELSVLKGMRNVLKNGSDISVFVCTYHNEDDEKDIKAFFNEIGGYEIEMSKGYMIMYYDKNIREPYLRRGVLRAYKRDNGTTV